MAGLVGLLAVVSGVVGLYLHESQSNTDRWLGFMLFGFILGLISIALTLRKASTELELVDTDRGAP